MFKEENPSPYEMLAGIHIASNKTGWGTKHDWKEWLTNHFEPKTRQWDVGCPIWRLMLVDSYRCPIHEHLFLWCRDHKILYISYPRKRRNDLNPFHWGVFKTIERGYKRWLYMRWKTELEKNNNHSCHGNASGQVTLKRREFAGILTRITVAGSAPRVAQRKAEAKNAWRTGTLFVISNAATDRLEDGEREDDYVIVDDKEDSLDDVKSSSHSVGNSVYSDEEDIQSSSSESDDSADDSWDDCSYTESPVRGGSCSRVAENPFATARVTRSQSRARSVALAAASRASSPDSRRRRSPSPVRFAYRKRGRSRSRPKLETPSRPYVRVLSRPANALLRPQSEHSSYYSHERANLSSPVPGLSHSFTGSSPLTGSSSVAVQSRSPSFSPGSDLVPSLNTTRKRTLNEIMDNHERAVKALKVLPADERKVHEQFLMDSLRAQILTSAG
ncbi:hypothetical protein N7488_004346 [Penicillium malachiteum]|nr:hypothetical protein N7488_004346 [Penicillium malachiteum]